MKRARRIRWAALCAALIALLIAVLVIGPIAVVAVLVAVVLGALVLVAQNAAGEFVERVRGWLGAPPAPSHLLVEPRAVSDWTATELGARRSTVAERLSRSPDAPYAPFEGLDDELDEMLADGSRQIVAIAGPAAAGKTRMLYEGVVRQCPDSPLVVPDPKEPGCLDDLLRSASYFAGDASPVIVWLDNVERYLVSGALNRRHLEVGGTGKPRFLFVATIRRQELDALRVGGPADSYSADSVLVERLSREAISLTADTPLRAGTDPGRLYEQLDLTHGIGAALTRLDTLRGRYLDSQADPIGLTLARAVVDLRRVGLEGPFSTELVVAAAALEDAHGAARTEAAVAHGWEWANTSVDGQADLRLLSEERPGQWSIDDVLVDLDQGARKARPRQVPNGIWEVAVESATPMELVAIGTTARAAERITESNSAFRRAVAGDDPDAIAIGAFNIAAIQHDQGDIAAAIEAYEQVWSTGHALYAQRAMYNLAALYREEGDDRKAIDSYLLAEEGPNDEARARAAVNLGSIYFDEGKRDEAIAAYRRGFESRDPEATAMGGLNLGVIYADMGDIEGAIAAFEGVIETGFPEGETEASGRLAELFMDRKEPLRAIPHYEFAEQREREPMRARLAVNLGTLYEAVDRIDDAIAAYTRGIESEDLEARANGGMNLGILYRTLGDTDSAIEALQQARDVGFPAVEGPAAGALGGLLRRSHRPTEAVDAYRQAEQSDEEAASATAAARLGEVLEELEDLDEARAAYERALDSDDPGARALGGLKLGLSYEREGRAEKAIGYLEGVLREDVEGPVAHAACHLGRLCEQTGDTGGAMASFERAAASAHPLYSPVGRMERARLLEGLDRTAEAREEYRIVANGHVPKLAEDARSKLRELGGD